MKNEKSVLKRSDSRSGIHTAAPAAYMCAPKQY